MNHQGRPPRGNFAVTKEEKKKVRGLKNTLALLKMAHLPKSAYAKVIIFYILSMLASVAVSLIDVQLVLAITSTSLDFFVQLVIIGFITLIFNEIISRINTIVDLKFQNMIVKEIDKVNYNQIFNLKIADFDQKSSAEFETRVHSAQNISDLLVSLLSTIHRVIKNLSYCIVILIRVPILSLVSFVFGLINTLCLRALRPKTLALSHKNWMENGVPMDSLSREALYGIRDIKGLDIGDEIKRQYTIKQERYLTRKVEIHKYRETWATLIGFVYAIGIALQFLLALYFYDNGMLTISNWILFITYQGCFKQMFWALDDFMTCIGDVEVTAVRGNDLYNPALFPVEKFGDVHLDNMQGKIELKNLDFEYIENRPVLENVSLNIEPNQVTALVGRSGEGKSTILSLIAKFYDAKDGQLFIDGHDINTLDAASIRTNISKIEQNPYIFNATFKENLLMVKPDATDEEIAAACKNSEIYDFIMSTERGFDTLVGENGITLSGGQKQRLAIARALLKSSKVIMFDESTSSLDNDSQRKIQQIIENLASDHTIVVVAHRLTTIKNADKIIFFNDHKVVATGTHEELMQTCEDYKNLYLNEDVE